MVHGWYMDVKLEEKVLFNQHMALFKAHSAAVYGIDAHMIDVEVDLYKSGSARDFFMVGMPDTAVRESRERVRSAIINSGFMYPNKGMTINLHSGRSRDHAPGRSVSAGR